MTSRKVILRRITALYVIFFAVIAFSVVRTVSQFSGEDFNTGRNDAIRLFATQTDASERVDILYELRTTTSTMDFEIPIHLDTIAGPDIYARPASLDVKAVSSTAGKGPIRSYNTFYGLLGMVIYAAIFVILFIIIASLRRSLRRDEALRKSNIALTRAIGIMLIAASLLFSLMNWLEACDVAPYFAGTDYRINTSFQFNFNEIIMGVLIFIIAEVFSISSMIGEEQKLTI